MWKYIVIFKRYMIHFKVSSYTSMHLQSICIWNNSVSYTVESLESFHHLGRS